MGINHRSTKTIKYSFHRKIDNEAKLLHYIQFYITISLIILSIVMQYACNVLCLAFVTHQLLMSLFCFVINKLNMIVLLLLNYHIIF